MKVTPGVLLAVVLAGCTDHPIGPPQPPPSRLVVLTSVTTPEALHMGDTARAMVYRLDSRGLPITPDSVEFVLSSTDTTVAIVDDTGMVTIVGLGSAEIVAQLKDKAADGPSTKDTASGRLRVTGTYTVIDDGPVIAAALAYEHQCIVRSGGQAYCRGANSYKQLGDGTQSPHTDWVPVIGGYSFTSISAGNYHTCGLTTDQRAICWGRAHHGQVGNGTGFTTLTSDPAEVIGDRRWLSIDAGGHGATCGVNKADSVAYCFGHNDYGQTGRMPLSPSDTVVAPIMGAPQVRGILTEHAYMCALRISGAVYCSGFWGPPTNTPLSDQSLGTGTPTRIDGSQALVRISIGSDHGCGLSAAGAAYCWGYNDYGQGGVPDLVSAGTIRAVVGAPAFRSIHVADMRSCGITSDGEVWCWGVNGGDAFGRLYDRLNFTATPMQVRLGTKMRWLHSGDEGPYEACGITESDKLICWGYSH